MNILLTSFFYLSMATTILSILIVLGLWNRRNAVGATYLIALELVVAIWAFGGGFEVIAQTVAQKVFWSKITYIGISGVSIFYALFAIDFTQLGDKLKQWHRYLFGIVPVITLIVAWLYPHSRILWENVTMQQGVYIAIYEHGWYFWVNTIYIYGTILLASFILIRSAVRFPDYYKTHIAVILLSVLFPLIGNLIYISGVNPIPGVEWTPIGFSMSGVLYAWAIFSQDMFKVVPVARNQLIEEMNDGLLVVDALEKIVDINPTAKGIFPSSQTSHIGQDIKTLIPSWASHILDSQGGSVHTEYQLDNSPKTFELHISTLKAVRGREIGYLVTVRDITRRKQTESALIIANDILTEKIKEIEKLQMVLREQAIRDPLTALYNRRYLEESMNSELPRALREGYNIGLVMLDIDRFKEFNDTYGHRAGDLMLIALAEQLERTTRQGDIVCRYGGEEFVILMPYIHGQVIYRRAEKIRQNFEQLEIDFESQKLSTTISLGISIFPHHGLDEASLLHRADVALYSAKAAGKNQTVIWSELLEKELLEPELVDASHSTQIFG